MRKYEPKLIEEEPTFSLRKVIIILLIITGILLVFYLITVKVIENTPERSTNTESVIQREKIIFGQLLDRKEEEYYVIAYKFTGNFTSLYTRYIKKYATLDDDLKFYQINLEDGFNQSYISDKENISNNIKELRVSDDTLFKIKNGQIEEHITGYNNIVNKLKEISATK